MLTMKQRSFFCQIWCRYFRDYKP